MEIEGVIIITIILIMSLRIIISIILPTVRPIRNEYSVLVLLPPS